ncbi:MAG: MATE family efflux transporter [Paludibacteraceae bacterium]|nr:MATE family efflux transporter [Paludibacteraceae bacterium]
MADLHALGTANVRKLLWEYSLPAIVAMLASSLYNIVDSIFIGHGVGALAISGLAITFPLMNLSAAFGSLIGAGGATLLSIKMGQHDVESAERVLGNIVSLNLLLGTLFMLFGLLFLEPILLFFGASSETLPYAYDYMFVLLIGNLVTHLYLGLNSAMRSTGAPRKAMLTTLMTVFINCVLDPLFIFVFDWGIRGAALATVVAQLAALIYTLVHFLNPRQELHFKRDIFTLRRRVAVSIFSIGMAPFVLNACSCLVVVVINQSLLKYGSDLAVGAYGIVNRIMMLFGMLVLGFNQGMQPIAGYNYGALKMDRVKSVLKQTILYASLVMTTGFLVVELFPELVARMFTTDAELLSISETGLRIVFAMAPVVGFQMVVSNFFQSIGHASKAVFLSSTRQLLFLVPLLVILPHFFGVIGVWLSLPISDVLSSALAAVVLFRDKMFNSK